MSFEFHLPDIGEGVIEGEIVSWKVQEGDKVDLDQPIVEIMTDKATVEIPSPRAGRIAKINFQEGEICPVGDVLLVIDDGGAAVQVVPAAASKNGNRHSAQPPAPAAAVALPEVIDATASRARVPATPATRRLARQLSVDLSHVTGSGKRGRVTSDDVRNHATGAVGGFDESAVTLVMPRSELDKTPATSSPTASTVVVRRGDVPAISVPVTGEEQRVPFRGMRKTIADKMSRSKNTAAHFTYVEEVDMTDLVALRGRAKAKAAERGVNLTYLPFILKAVVSGLQKWPSLNASLDETTNEVVRKKYYHIGVAAQGPNGLMVSVVRNADQLSIFDIAGEVQRLGQAVQDGTATRDDLVGSTFTISSLGKLGGVLATPIINFPEVGILGVHKIEEKPAVRNGEIVIRSLMNLSISLDHRLVDGWDGAMFLQDVKTLLEDPTLMFMEMR